MSEYTQLDRCGKCGSRACWDARTQECHAPECCERPCCSPAPAPPTPRLSDDTSRKFWDGVAKGAAEYDALPENRKGVLGERGAAAPMCACGHTARVHIDGAGTCADELCPCGRFQLAPPTPEPAPCPECGQTGTMRERCYACGWTRVQTVPEVVQSQPAPEADAVPDFAEPPRCSRCSFMLRADGGCPVCPRAEPAPEAPTTEYEFYERQKAEILRRQQSALEMTTEELCRWLHRRAMYVNLGPEHPDRVHLLRAVATIERLAGEIAALREQLAAAQSDADTLRGLIDRIAHAAGYLTPPIPNPLPPLDEFVRALLERRERALREIVDAAAAVLAWYGREDDIERRREAQEKFPNAGAALDALAAARRRALEAK